MILVHLMPGIFSYNVFCTISKPTQSRRFFTQSLVLLVSSSVCYAMADSPYLPWLYIERRGQKICLIGGPRFQAWFILLLSAPLSPLLCTTPLFVDDDDDDQDDDDSMKHSGLNTTIFVQKLISVFLTVLLDSRLILENVNKNLKSKVKNRLTTQMMMIMV